MQVFPRETTDYISKQFSLYFERQREKRAGLSLKDARTLVDFVGEPTPVKPAGVSGFDYSKPSVQGGGRTRPSEVEVGRIIENAEKQPLWDEVFTEVMRRCEREPEAEKFVQCVWRDGMGEEEACKALQIGRTTYYETRSVILGIAGALAVSKNILKY